MLRDLALREPDLAAVLRLPAEELRPEAAALLAEDLPEEVRPPCDLDDVLRPVLAELRLPLVPDVLFFFPVVPAIPFIFQCLPYYISRTIRFPLYSMPELYRIPYTGI